jgi:NADPH2:quinone reductase
MIRPYNPSEEEQDRRELLMDAAVVRKLGKPPQCEQFPEPVAGDNEVIVHVHAASLKPVDKQLASGSHYASPREVPFICGTDGVGHLDDGQRVFFGGCRPPYGAMAQRTVVPRAFVFHVPAGVSDGLAAALPNPGVSAWLALTFRAKLAPNENVLILGATGVTGRLAVRIAKLLGAGRVVAAGRNQQTLLSLRQLGADATIRLDMPAKDLRESFVREAGQSGFQVVIDYVWGQPTEAFLSAITSPRFAAIGTETRLVQVGESAGPTISLPAAVLRSTALTILGTAGVPTRDVLADALQRVMAYAADRKLQVDTMDVPLVDIESAWERNQSGRRIVIIP